MSESNEKRLTVSKIAQRWGVNETKATRVLDRHGCERNSYGWREPTEQFVRDIERKDPSVAPSSAKTARRA